LKHTEGMWIKWGWVIAQQGYMTRRLLPVQNHLSLTFEWLCHLQLF